LDSADGKRVPRKIAPRWGDAHWNFELLPEVKGAASGDFAPLGSESNGSNRGGHRLAGGALAAARRTSSPRK